MKVPGSTSFPKPSPHDPEATAIEKILPPGFSRALTCSTMVFMP